MSKEHRVYGYDLSIVFQYFSLKSAFSSLFMAIALKCSMRHLFDLFAFYLWLSTHFIPMFISMPLDNVRKKDP